jgi:RND family efflux transporter MFP subunit
LGLVIRQVLASRERTPAERPPEELTRTVRVIRLKSEQTTVEVSGYGTARPARTTDLSAELRGRIVFVREELKPGTLVAEGELLYRIDPVDFQVALDQTRADLDRLSAELAQLDQQERDDRRRLVVLKRTHELADKEFRRFQGLFQEQQISSESDVERAEQAARQREEAVIGQESALALYPSRRQSLQAQRARAQAQQHQASVNLERCQIRSPWRGRVLSQNAELGQVVAAGQSLVTLADDRYLEVPVTLNSDETFWALDLNDGNQSDYIHWFGTLNLPQATLTWVDDTRCRWTARAVRIETYDPQTRTLTLVVRPLEPVDATAVAIPLVAGMFCRATLPSRTFEAVVIIPRTAIQLGGNVLVVDAQGRASERVVNVVHNVGNRAVLSSGLSPGEVIVVTRLSGILDGMKVKTVDVQSEATGP